MNTTLLSVEGLTASYATRQGEVRAVSDVSFSLRRGEVLGLVGESGSGKTTIAVSLLRLLPDSGRLIDGRIFLDGQDLVSLDEDGMRRVRWNRISMIFQAAMNSLNPVYKVGEQIIEVLEQHTDLSLCESQQKVRDLFDMVGLDHGFIGRYPHEYSGGMKQRAIIAMALACDPDIIIADEPTTALDVIVQDKVLREMREIQKRLDMGMIYISHDIGVIAEITDLVGVMYAGKLVEMGSTVEIFRSPIHPYTAALISAFPSVMGDKRELAALQGEPPNLIDPPQGCRFHPRCPYATGVCGREEPPIVKRGERWAACWNPL